jgi:outer membrane receptor protein involved in Fe transport
MSLSAFTDAMIEDRQIVGLLDVQLNSPNVSATDGNYADREFSIRGLGNLLDTQGRTQQSVSYHINEVPLAPPRAYGVSVRWNFGG